MKPSSLVRTFALISILFLFPTMSLSLHAASAVEERVPQAAFRFDIPAGALGDALAAFEAVTGLTVAAPERATVHGLYSPGVAGTYTADQALERLLEGTGLTFRMSAANSYSLEVRPLSESVEVRGTLPYSAELSTMATRTLTPLRDVPQSITVITSSMIADQRMQGMADVVRYVPGVVMGQGEGNRDAPVLRGNNTTADFFVDGVRDDVQYFRDLYNVERIEALKGPNAMIFGRGGGGGVINRATRQADWGASREITLQGGSHDNRRVTFDVDHPVASAVAARVTGMYESSESYRRGVNLERYGINPTAAFMLRQSTMLRVGFERFHDDRTADRGIPSFGNRPVASDVSTFFGDPERSNSTVTVNALGSTLDHKFAGGVLLRSRTRYAGYDKFYQNIYPSRAVSADGTTATLSAYNNTTERRNLFNQTDLNVGIRSGRIRHTVLAGVELGRQVTDNLRQTGYFTSVSPTATSFAVPVSAPTVSVPMEFRQSASDASNHGTATVAAIYAQDQLELTRHLQAIVGLRYDRFSVDFRNNRTSDEFESADDLVSPRAGLIYKPLEPLSLYTSYSIAYLPRAGEQLSSLSLTNQALDPEKFVNYEVGAKWDIRRDLGVTAALYRLDRTNVVIPDPVDASRSLLADGQRVRGVELGVAGNLTPAWTVIGGYAWQDGRIRRTLSASAQAGAVLAQVPEHGFSIWNRYNFSHSWGVGLGVVHSGDMFASTDNTVVLPAFTRVDGAVFVNLPRQMRAQVNIENLFDERYYAFSNGNNNITPGALRTARVSLTTRF